MAKNSQIMPGAGLTSNAATGTPAAPATADTSGSKLAGLAKLKTAGKKVVLTTKLTGHEDHDDFEQYGSLAGPPGRPVATDVEAATCVLRWEPPRHTGGRGIAVVGYHITVQFAGDGGFFVHTPDTGSFDPNMLLQGLRPDTWHEFQVAAITAGGVGAPSLPSRPAQTPRAPQLHRDLEAAKLALQKTRTKLTEKRDALMRMGAGGAGMAPTGGMGIYGPGASGGAAPGGALLDGAAKGSHRHKKAVQREIDALQQKAAVQLRRLDALQSRRAAELRQQRLRMLEAAGAELPPELKAMQEQREKAKRAKEQSVDGQIDALVAAAKGDAPAPAAASASAAAPPAAPSAAAAPPAGDTTATKPALSGWKRMQAAAVSGKSSGETAQKQQERGAIMGVVQAAKQRRELTSGAVGSDAWRQLLQLHAYKRLFEEDDLREAERAAVRYTDFHRERCRARVFRALSAHVLADGDLKLWRYFNLVVNRIRATDRHALCPALPGGDAPSL